MQRVGFKKNTHSRFNVFLHDAARCTTHGLIDDHPLHSKSTSCFSTDYRGQMNKKSEHNELNWWLDQVTFCSSTALLRLIQFVSLFFKYVYGMYEINWI